MRFSTMLCVGCLLAWSAPIQADESVPVPLTKVPGDAVAFLHVDAAKAWDHPIGLAVRTLGGKPVKELFDEFEKTTGFNLTDLETLTLYWPTLMQPGDEQTAAFIFTTREPYDRAKVLKAANDDSDAKPDNAGFYLFKSGSSDDKLRVHFTSPTMFAILHQDLAKAYLDAKPTLQTGPHHEALERAASGKHTAVGAINLAKSPRDMLLEMPPPELRPYLPLFKSSTVTAWVDLGNAVDATVQFEAEGPGSARDCEDALTTVLRLFEQLLEDGKEEFAMDESNDAQKKIAMSVMDNAVSVLKAAKVHREGTAVSVSTSAKLEKSFVPNVLKLILDNGSPRSSISQNNLKQIGLAMHNYHDANNGFPPATILGKGGKPMLSWRVAILPYVEQQALYNQFKFDEPWDSEHNKKLIAQMPPVFRLPGQDEQTVKDGITHYRVLTGGGAAFDRVLPVRLSEFRDGTSNTILAVEAEEGVPWTKPEPLEYDPKKPLPKLLFNSSGRCHVLFGDGSVRGIPKDIAEKTLRALITRSGGEVIGDF